MSQSYIPSELTYEPEPAPEAVVIERSERQLFSPNPSHDSATSSVLRFKIDSAQMVDLSSLKLYAAIEATAAGGNTGVIGAGTTTTKALLASTYSLFSRLQVSTGAGQVIESIADADVLGEVVSKMSFSEDWANTSGTFQNAELDGYRRDNGTGIEFEMGALNLLGFLKSGKTLMPDSVGGLVIELTMNPSSRVFVGRAAGDSFTIKLNRAHLVWDELRMSQSYSDWFRAQYESRGYRINFTTYQGHSSVVASGTTSQTVAVALSGKRTKALISVVRPVSYIDNVQAHSQGFIAPTNLRTYQYAIGSQRYPPAPVSTAVKAHSEALKIGLAHGNCQRQTSSMEDWSNNFALGAGEQASHKYGAFMMCVDLEKLNSTDKSGVTVPSSGGSLSFDMDTGIGGDMRVDTFSIRDQSLTVINGAVQVDF